MFTICSISALLSFQLLPQPRLPGCRGRALLRRLGGCSPEFTCVSCGQVLHLENAKPVRAACAEGNWEDGQCGEERWQPGMRSCLQTSAARGAGSFALEPAHLPASLRPADKGSEEGWCTLDIVEVRSSFYCSWPIY